jgi:hypothetical protein
MALFTDTDLQAFSDLAQDLALKDTACILREIRTPIAGGGSVTTWAIVAQPPCMVVDSGQSPTEQAIAQQSVGQIYKRVFFPRLTDVRSTDRLSINGTLYEIIDLFDPTTYEVLRRVEVKQNVIRSIVIARNWQARARIV